MPEETREAVVCILAKMITSGVVEVDEEVTGQ